MLQGFGSARGEDFLTALDSDQLGLRSSMSRFGVTSTPLNTMWECRSQDPCSQLLQLQEETGEDRLGNIPVSNDSLHQHSAEWVWGFRVQGFQVWLCVYGLVLRT